MRIRHAAAIAVLWTLAFGVAAANDAKTLQNLKGAVDYQQPHATPNPLAPRATIALPDRDYTITGADSLAQLTLPEGSRVMIGANSKVELTRFDQAAIAHASFVIVRGQTRFAVIHPAGARADYVFHTSTATISVRGTQGDIGYDPSGTLRVNVYEVCNPALPVEVTTAAGETYTLTAGQSLLAKLVDGVVRVQIERLTQALIDRFSPDFGVPTSWNAAKGAIVSYATNAANGATNGYAGAIGSAIGGLFGHHARPTPAPTPSTCR